MRKLYLLSTLALVVLCSEFVTAQDFSNKGKEFWFCFPNHIPSGANGSMSLWITSDKATSGTVTMTNGAFSATFNIPANGIQSINIPHALAHISNAESGIVIQKSIRVKADPGKPAFVAYAQQYGNARSAATLLLPVNVLGKKYRAVSFTHTPLSGGGQNAKSQFQVIATKANTLVKVTPFSNGVVGTSFTIPFPNVGDMYQYQADADITGTLIESVAGAGTSCSPIAVFSGNSSVTIGTTSCSGNSYDPLFQQDYPITTWGKNFGFIPFGDYTNGNPYRVMASEDNTKVSFNGIVVATLNAGEIYPSAFTSNPVTLTTATSITADKPVCVTEYAQTSACSGTNNGDPDMVILNPIEQNIKDITIFSSTQQNINRQWLNVLIKTIAAPSFRIDGAVPSTAFQPAPNIPGYSYLKHLFTPATQGSHFLQADSGFNAICYGFQAGQFESYAYSAGTNVKDLYQQIGVSTEYGIEPTPSVCNGSPFKFKVSLPYCADSISWDLSFLPGPPIPAPTSIYSTCTAGAGGPDSTTVVNGVTLYWYSLPSIYAFNVSGSYPVTITTYTPNLDGCGTEQDIDFELNVYDPPVADFNITNSGCIAEAVRFFDNTTTPRPSYIWNWDFGDPGSGPANTSGLQNPSHLFSAPGTYTVKFSTITTPGCISSEITKQVTVAPVPTATIAGTTTVCLNDPQPPITFTATDGTAPYTFSYHINGGPAIHLSSPTNTSTVNVPTNVAGTFTYYLDSVKNTGSSLCVTNYTNTFAEVVVNANTGLALDAGSNNSQAVCKNSSIANIFYTISGGGTNATISWLPAPPAGLTGVYNLATKKFNISGTPTVAGVYTYTVQATGPCLPNQLSGTITVNEIPTASITGTTEVCLNAPSPPVTFTGAGGVAPYTFNYKLNGVPQTPIISAGNTYVINVPTNVATTLIYDLTNVTDASSTLCSQAQIGTATVIVNSLPTALFNVTAPTCESRVLTFTDLSTPNSGALNGWAWTFGDATTSNQQNPTHTYPAAGTYTVTLTVTTDKGCASLPIASIPVTVNTRPQAGFIVPEVCINDAATVFTDTSHIATG